MLPGEFEYTEHTKDFQNVEMQDQEMIMKELNMEILPEAEKRELFGFYEYLVDKYTKKGCKTVGSRKRQEGFACPARV
ncbi:MAG: hypothetical protein Q3M24_05160 [Candidatus Electrothrix aestuarii]|uniref:Uncharacterized protein n=1 Tax=Candidatus Electrothrix aestuarii TaxID=3062594 RepID=A0AAU8LZA8_9BACT